MRTFVALLVISSMVLSGCSRLRESRLNPGNWFGGGSPRPVATANASANNPLIPKETRIRRRDRRDVYEGTPVDRITNVTVERTSTGAIVKVTAVALQQGAHDVRLTPDGNAEPIDGVLTLRMMAVQPTDQPQGQPRQRTLHAGRYISNGDLTATNVIRVVGARNEQTVRR